MKKYLLSSKFSKHFSLYILIEGHPPFVAYEHTEQLENHKKLVLVLNRTVHNKLSTTL